MSIFFNFWFYVLLIPIAAVVMDGVKSLYRMRLKHEENLERLRLGYPTLDDGKPVRRNDDIIDMTGGKPGNGN